MCLIQNKNYPEEFPKIKQFICSSSFKMSVKPDMTVQSEETQSLLNLAMALGQRDFFKFLLKNGGDPNITYMMSLLHAAVSKFDLDYIEFLLKHGAEINKNTSTNFGGSSLATVLKIACDLRGMSGMRELEKQAASDTVKFLLENGSDANIPDSKNETPLGAIAKVGDLESIKLLLAHRAKIDEKSGSESLTPLQIACSSSKPNIEVIKFLLERGANPNIRDSKNQTPLGVVVNAGNLELTKCLLEHGAKIDEKSGPRLQTPLQIACSSYNLNKEIIKYLLEKKADPNITDSVSGGMSLLGKTSRMRMSGDRSRQVAALKLLLEHGAKIDEKSGTESRTPLQLACFSPTPSIEVIKCLLEAGADPNIPLDEKGTTILNEMKNMDEPEIISLLKFYRAEEGVK